MRRNKKFQNTQNWFRSRYNAIDLSPYNAVYAREPDVGANATEDIVWMQPTRKPYAMSFTLLFAHECCKWHWKGICWNMAELFGPFSAEIADFLKNNFRARRAELRVLWNKHRRRRSAWRVKSDKTATGTSGRAWGMCKHSVQAKVQCSLQTLHVLKEVTYTCSRLHITRGRQSCSSEISTTGNLERSFIGSQSATNAWTCGTDPVLFLQWSRAVLKSGKAIEKAPAKPTSRHWLMTLAERRLSH